MSANDYLLRARHLPDSPLTTLERGDRTWIRMRFSLQRSQHAYLEILDSHGVRQAVGGCYAEPRRALVGCLAREVARRRSA